MAMKKRPLTKAGKPFKHIVPAKKGFTVGDKRKVHASSLAEAKKIDRTKAFFKYGNKKK